MSRQAHAFRCKRASDFRGFGIVSLGDVAIKTDESQKRDVEDVVEMVSAPSTNSGGIVGQVDDVAGRTGEGGGAEAGTAGGAGAGGTDDGAKPTTAGDAMGVSGNAETLLDGAADADADIGLLTSGGEGAGAAGGDDNGAGGIDLPLAGDSGNGPVGASASHLMDSKTDSQARATRRSWRKVGHERPEPAGGRPASRCLIKHLHGHVDDTGSACIPADLSAHLASAGVCEQAGRGVS